MQVNDNDLTISVVIPAFNVERFIEKAIQSVIAQPEVTEIVVVDDGSKDDTKEIIERLSRVNGMVKYYQHAGGINKGRAATRNLGIEKSTSSYVSFLDADDFFLENRFKKDLEVLNDNTTDGCYNAVGFYFYREPEDVERIHYKLSTLSKIIDPEALFENIVTSKLGYLHLNGLTIKKTALLQVGLINENLKVAEDSDLLFKLAMKFRMKPSVLDKPLALRGIHESNVFNQHKLYKKYVPILFESLLSWSFKYNIAFRHKDLLLNALWIHRFRQCNSLFRDSLYSIKLTLKTPKLFLTNLPIKYFPIIRKRKQLFSFMNN